MPLVREMAVGMKMTPHTARGPDGLVHHVVVSSKRQNVIMCTALSTNVRRAAQTAFEYCGNEGAPTCFECLHFANVFGEALR